MTPGNFQSPKRLWHFLDITCSLNALEMDCRFFGKLCVYAFMSAVLTGSLVADALILPTHTERFAGFGGKWKFLTHLNLVSVFVAYTVTLQLQVATSTILLFHFQFKCISFLKLTVSLLVRLMLNVKLFQLVA